MLQHAVLAFSVAAILAPFSYYAGLGAKLLRLPQITGYLISGIICGPYVLGILSRESVTDLSIIEGACLSIIGLAAGAELHLPELSRAKKQVRVMPSINIQPGFVSVACRSCGNPRGWSIRSLTANGSAMVLDAFVVG